MSNYSWTSGSLPSYHHHPVDPYLGDFDVDAAMQPRYSNIEPVGSRRPALNNNNHPSVGPGNSFSSPSTSNNTVLPNSNASGADSNGRVHYLSIEETEEVLIDHQYSPFSTSLTSAPASTASHMRTGAPVDRLNGMTRRTTRSTSVPTSRLPFGLSSTPNWPAQSSAQPNHSNSSPPPSPPMGTQSSDVDLNILPTFFSLPSLDMTTFTPYSLSAAVPVPLQTGASTSGSSLQTAGLPPNGPLSFQIQANPVLPQQHIQPQLINFDDGDDDDDFVDLSDDDGRDDPVVCVVCGGICKVTFVSNHHFDNSLVLTPRTTPDWMRPILVQAKPRYLEWLKQRPSARTPYRDGAELIEQIQVTAFLGGSQGMKLGSDKLHINTMDPLMRIPVHKACFEIARIFCEDQTRYNIGFRSASGGAPSSIPQLYEIWCKRAIASHPVGLMSKPILEANKYYGAPVCGRMAAYHRKSKDPLTSRFLAYPLAISGLTDVVVNSNLQTMDGKVKQACNELAGLLGRIQDLPQEITDQITAALEPFEEDWGLPLQPTRVLPPNWWRKRLFSGKLIPWLWDLNEDDVLSYRAKNFYKHNPDDAVKDRERGKYIFDENVWDWELLCRQLAQSNVMQGAGVLAGKSDQVWNRRRIWKLLDAARLGHIRFP
ncbi:hypothetical protein F4782DRAFT_531075 [Xylaria castorea]|nr:hypothetical protein F4782DRAFT_531075 [Xylaria castorea]